MSQGERLFSLIPPVLGQMKDLTAMLLFPVLYLHLHLSSACCLSSPYRKCYAVAVDRSDKSNHSTPVMVISVSSLYSALERSFLLCPAE